MQQTFSNECPAHQEVLKCYCPNCGLVMCGSCSTSHTCPKMKKKTIEYLDESLLWDFRFEKFLGKGTFGSVFEVLSHLDNRIYALKLIEDVNKDTFLKARVEIALMAKINHPNIVQYYASHYQQEKELLWITMELCHFSLSDQIKQLSKPRAMNLFKQICEGIKVLHCDYQIIHRDLKPGNILITKDNIAKLCDFGEAKELKSGKSNITLSNLLGFGTYEYLPPEVFDIMADKDFKGKYSFKSDIWALGVIFYKMLTNNKHPYLEGVKMKDEDKISTIRSILHSGELIFDEIQDPLAQRILKGSLEKSPGKRMDITDILRCFDFPEEEKKENVIVKGELSQKNKTNNEKKLSVSLKSATTWKLGKTLKDHCNSVKSVCFSTCDNGMKIVSASNDETVKIWDANSGNLRKTFKGHTDWVNCVSFSPNQMSDVKVIASGGSDDHTVKLWDASKGTLIRSCKTGVSSVLALCFSPDGKYLINSSGSFIQFRDPKNGVFMREIKNGNSDSTVRSLSVSPDGSLIASGSIEKFVKLWEVSSGKLLNTFEPGHQDEINSVCFSHNKKLIASGSKDKTVKLWDVVDGKLVKTLEGHSNWVTSVCFLPDDITIISGSHDNSIKFWDVLTGNLLTSLDTGSTVYCINVSPDGRKIASGQRDNSIKIWIIEEQMISSSHI